VQLFTDNHQMMQAKEKTSPLSITNENLQKEWKPLISQTKKFPLFKKLALHLDKKH
jgi:hypothetical protein